MARNRTAAQITEAHRLAQGRIGAATAAQMITVWPLLDLGDLNGTFDRWLRGSIPIIQANRTASAQLAASYYRAFRAASLPRVASFPAVVAGPASLDAVTGGLMIAGPAAIKQAIARGIPAAQAEAVAQTESARTAMYYALAGGQETVVETAKADPRAVGWARAASGDACAFCAMLASRGPVYRSEDSGSFECHPGCQCTAEPTYSRHDPWPAGSRDYQRRWNESQRGVPKSDRGLNAFRRSMAPAEDLPATAG